MAMGPLDGFTVVDFSSGAAGPYGAGLLGMAGADVIKVEPPGGNPYRDIFKGAIFANVGQNKRSLILDLKSEESDDIIRALVAEADVTIHNFLASTAEKLGLDYDTLRRYNEQIVHCLVTGFGAEGEYKDRVAYDPIAQAMSGIMAATGEPDRKPSRIGTSMIDWSTGMYAAMAITFALLNRERTDSGEKLEVSLFDTAASFMGYHYTLYSLFGDAPQRSGHVTTGVAPYALIETATDPVYLAIAQDHQWDIFCEEFGREEWINDDRFETNATRDENREVLLEVIEEELCQYSQAEVIDRLEGKVPVGELNEVHDVAYDEHLHDRGTLKEIPIPAVDEREGVVQDIPISFQNAGKRAETFLSAPGEHSAEVLAELGYDDDAIASFEDADVI